jgi:hypothetical protein
MKRFPFFLAALILFGTMPAGMAGCGGGAKVMQIDADAADVAAPGGKDARSKAKRKPGKKDVATKEDDEEAADRSGARFEFPADRGQKLLDASLPPHRQAGGLPNDDARGPRPMAPARPAELPDLPLPPSQAGLPQPDLDKPGPTLRPAPPPEEPPLTWQHSTPQAPERPKLPTGKLARAASPEAERALPLLGQAPADRGPLSDPTEEFSTTAALAGVVLPRTTPAPFVRINLPDPFEHRQTVRLRKRLKEELPPGVGSSRPMK